MPYLLVFLSDELLRLVRDTGHHGNGEVGAALPGQFAARSKTAHACNVRSVSPAKDMPSFTVAPKSIHIPCSTII